MYVFDLDGTLSIVGDRVKHLNQDPPDWDSFYNRCGEDEPNRPILNLYNALYGLNCTVVLTGRREDTRQQTLRWFQKYNIARPNYLLMRPIGDTRHDVELKPELLRSVGGTPAKVRIIFEDRNSVVQHWRKSGYTCLQVAEGDF